MKRKTIICSIVGFLLIAITAAFVWYVTPKTFLKGIDANEVASIDVFDGNTGKSMTIDDPNDIKTVVESVQSVKMKRGKLSANYDGFSFSLTFNGRDGDVIDIFIINGKDTIRDDPFFYHCEDGGLCYEFLKELWQE